MASRTFSQNSRVTASGSIDMLGDEFPSLTMGKERPAITEADIVAYCTQGPNLPRPTVTAWEGADIDAFWFDKGTWRHCQTGKAWEGHPVNLLEAARRAEHIAMANNFMSEVA